MRPEKVRQELRGKCGVINLAGEEAGGRMGEARAGGVVRSSHEVHEAERRGGDTTFVLPPVSRVTNGTRMLAVLTHPCLLVLLVRLISQTTS